MKVLRLKPKPENALKAQSYFPRPLIYLLPITTQVTRVLSFFLPIGSSAPNISISITGEEGKRKKKASTPEIHSTPDLRMPVYLKPTKCTSSPGRQNLHLSLFFTVNPHPRPIRTAVSG